MHPLEEDETPQETMDYLGDRVAHIHIKDGTTDPDPEAISYVYGPIGEGEMPIKEIVTVLKKAGYERLLFARVGGKVARFACKGALPHDAVLENYAKIMKEIDEETKGVC